MSMAARTERANELKRYEAMLKSGMADFVSIGAALSEIKERKLHKSCGFPCFKDYCQQKWGLAGRTAFLKIKVYRAYKNVLDACLQNADFSTLESPTSETQVRELLALHQPAEQLLAWQNAVAVWTNNIFRTGKMPAAEVRKAVLQLRKVGSTSFRQLLTADSSFSMIRYRLDVCLPPLGFRKPELLLDPKQFTETIAAPASGTVLPLVLVNPDYDLLVDDNLHTFIGELHELCQRTPSYRFLFWTKNFRCIDNWGIWPRGVELAILVSTQQEVDEFASYWRKHTSILRPQCALWVVPEERLTIPKQLELSRVLIGAPGWQSDRTDDDIGALRELVASLLDTDVPLHLSNFAANTFAREATVLPKKAKAAVSQVILDVISAEQAAANIHDRVSSPTTDAGARKKRMMNMISEANRK